MLQETGWLAGGTFLAILCLSGFAWTPGAIHATELSCEQGDNSEGACCCFQKAHTYEFDAMHVSRLEVTFDTGRGIGCRSQVDVQLLRRNGWQTLRTIDAISSSGRSQANRMGGTFDLDTTISGVRLDDGGRCYIDFSKIVFNPTSDPSGAEIVAVPTALVSGRYKLEAYSNRRHASLWDLEVSGHKITGSSEWDCCPGRRRDALKGTVRGRKVVISRACGGQGLSGRCEQVYEGDVANRGVVSGGWSHNGNFAGKWRLEPVRSTPVDPTDPPEPFGTRIVADPAPPYGQVPLTIDFALEPGPVRDAVWWLDGRRMTNADIFFWTFGAAGRHDVELRSERGDRLASYEVNLLRPATRRVEIQPDKAPPFNLPASLTFRQVPRPVQGARWYVDDIYASSAQTLTREFLEARGYQVTLKSRGGEELASYEVELESAAHRLWGRRRQGARNDLRELQLERSAEVTEIDGSARSYCIWTVAGVGAPDHRVVCGGTGDSIVGAILLPGRYVVIPDLANGQRVSEVTIHLRSR